MADEVLSIQEAARALGVHPDTIRRMIKSGEIKAFQVRGRYRIRRSEIDRLSSEESQQSEDDQQ